MKHENGHLTQVRPSSLTHVEEQRKLQALTDPPAVDADIELRDEIQRIVLEFDP